MTTTRKQPDEVDTALYEHLITLSNSKPSISDIWHAAVEWERERCAKIVERMLKNMPGYTLDIAAAIRKG